MESCAVLERPGLEFVTSNPTPPRRRAFLVVLSVVLIAAASAVAATRFTSNADAAELRHVFTAGQERTYGLSGSMSFTSVGIPGQGPMKGAMSATIHMKVLEVLPDGSAWVEMTISDMLMTGISGSSPPPGPMTVRMRIAPDGHAIEVEGAGSLFPMPGLGQGPAGGLGGPEGKDLFALFPRAKVAPGDTWDTTTEVPLFGDEKVTVRSKGRHDGFEKTAYGKAARIHQDVSMPLDVSFAFGEIMKGFASGLSSGLGGSGELPAGFGDTKMLVKGNVHTIGDVLVLPADGDLVQGHADIDMGMTMGFSGVPAALTRGGLSEFSVNGTVSMDVVRTA